MLAALAKAYPDVLNCSAPMPTGELGTALTSDGGEQEHGSSAGPPRGQVAYHHLVAGRAHWERQEVPAQLPHLRSDAVVR